MSRVLEGNFDGNGMKVAIVCSRFNDFIVKPLLHGAEDCLVRHGVAADDIAVAWVPGAYEIPMVAKRLAVSGNYDAVIALGAVIRGATTHYDFVAGGASNGLASAMLETGVPIMFGVITTESIEQAIERAGTKAGNKGAEAAISAIEMVNLLKAIDAS